MEYQSFLFIIQQQSINTHNMIMIKRCIFGISSLYTPMRGRILSEKWEYVIKQQQYHNLNWKEYPTLTKQKVTVPVVEALREYIRENPLVRMYLQTGLDSIPATVEQYDKDDFQTQWLKPRPGVCYGYTWQQLLDTFASICQTPPRFEDADLIGVPFYALVIDLLNTQHGNFFFSIPEVNAFLKLIFDAYGQMLDSPSSLQHMNQQENGWLSPAALKRVNYKDYICDPTAPHYGFKSWHDWFTREIHEEARPFSNDENEIINNSQSYPSFAPHYNVQWKDRFWLKDQKYSLAQMFEADTLPEDQQNTLRQSFVGGTVFQGYLNPWCYHRWRAPVSGVIEKCYSAGYHYFVSNPGLCSSLKQRYIASQPLLSMTSARQIYVIKADNPKIGRVCVMEIGMTEVSGIKNLVEEGQRINKGDLLGYFRFGGSSHLIIFDHKAANLRFNPSINERVLNPSSGFYKSTLQKVRSPLAWVS